MPYTKEEFIRESKEKMARDPDMIEIMVKAPAMIDRVLKDLSPEKRLEGISPEKRLEGMSVEALASGLSPEQREAMLRRLQAGE